MTWLWIGVGVLVALWGLGVLYLRLTPSSEYEARQAERRRSLRS